MNITIKNSNLKYQKFVLDENKYDIILLQSISFDNLLSVVDELIRNKYKYKIWLCGKKYYEMIAICHTAKFLEFKYNKFSNSDNNCGILYGKIILRNVILDIASVQLYDSLTKINMQLECIFDKFVNSVIVIIGCETLQKININKHKWKTINKNNQSILYKSSFDVKKQTFENSDIEMEIKY